MKALGLMVGLLCLPGMGLAAEVKPALKGATPIITVSRLACERLTRHVPAPDVAYEPGRDVRGRAVAPAELPSNVNPELPSILEIPLETNLTNWLAPGQTLARSQLGASTIRLGTISVQGNEVRYNGKPLTDPQQAELAVLCLRPRPPLGKKD